jgi:uncharacterized protein (TIGR00730 family)
LPNCAHMANDPLWPPKAYKNPAFLNSPEARKIRVLCEMTEPERRFAEENIKDTIVFFGSARSLGSAQAATALAAVKAELEGVEELSPEEAKRLRRAEAGVSLAPYYEAALELAKRMTLWSKSLRNREHRFLVCTGGGPGMMEAANRGAKEAAGASIGLGISLPFEQGINAYVTRDLAFEFHYFFVRKYWLAYWAKALVVFPGGFGTMDELFELLTLIQTHKVQKKLPIVLFGSAFWNDILNFEAFVKWGVISPEDLSLFRIIDSVDEAEAYLRETLTEYHLKKAGKSRNRHPPGPSA